MSDEQKNLIKICAHMCAHSSLTGAHIHLQLVGACIFTDYHQKNFFVLSYSLMTLSLKFQKDPRFGWGDIQLFVPLYNIELTILSFFSFSITA